MCAVREQAGIEAASPQVEEHRRPEDNRPEELSLRAREAGDDEGDDLVEHDGGAEEEALRETIRKREW